MLLLNPASDVFLNIYYCHYYWENTVYTHWPFNGNLNTCISECRAWQILRWMSYNSQPTTGIWVYSEHGFTKTGQLQIGLNIFFLIFKCPVLVTVTVTLMWTLTETLVYLYDFMNCVAATRLGRVLMFHLKWPLSGYTVYFPRASLNSWKYLNVNILNN